MDEKQFLSKLAKSLQIEEVLEDIESKKTKEKQILEGINRKLAKMTGIEYVPEPEPEEIVREVVFHTPEPEYVPEEIIQEEPELITEVVEEPEPLVEIARQPEPELPKKNVVDKYVKALSKATDQSGDADKIADKIPDVYRKELEIIKKSIADFHRFAQRHSQMGGGGAGSIDELTFNVHSVNQPTYQISRKDYYVGVNYAGAVSIYLPTQNLKQGRQVVVKDESGNCNQYNITISTVDGNSIDNNNTAILAINGGSLTFIFNKGWRII
jgi:hypothetical protein